MISSLHGTVTKDRAPELSVVVGGVGYAVQTPMTIWEKVQDGAEMTLLIEPVIREDKFDLYGFLQREDRTLFRKLTAVTGIGPKIALEICALPRSELARAIVHSDARVLSAIKGIGAKRAEKILPDLKSIGEDHPELLADASGGKGHGDNDALDALMALGYERAIVLKALRSLPEDMQRTEDRVAAVLRSL